LADALSHPFFDPARDGIFIRVRLTPKASANRVDGISADADGKGTLKVRVTAIPEAGKANKALIRLLSKEWKMAKTELSLHRGETDRNKIFFVAGDTDALGKRLLDWAGNY